MPRATHPLHRSAHKLLGLACACFAISLAALGLVTPWAAAQNDPDQTNNNPDQALRTTAGVNPSSLGMEMNIPLGNYPGRGINAPINLSYSSKVWRFQYVEADPKPHTTLTCRNVYEPRFAEHSTAGWTASMEIPYVEYTGVDEQYLLQGYLYGPYDICNTSFDPTYYIKRVEVHLPNGEAHELRADDTNYSAGTGSMDATYYAIDGSNLRYVENSSSGLYRLYMPDGSFYDFSSSTRSGNSSSFYTNDLSFRDGTTYTDRNGNYISYHAPASGHPNGYVTDTLGRSLDIPVNPQVSPTPGDQTYSVPGLSSGTVTYTLHWKQLKGSSSGTSALTNYSDSLKYTGQENWPGFTVNSSGTYLFANVGDNYAVNDGTFNPVVLAGIDLPNGLSYTFTYS